MNAKVRREYGVSIVNTLMHISLVYCSRGRMKYLTEY